MPRFRTSIPNLVENLNADRIDGRDVDDMGISTNDLWTADKIRNSSGSSLQANGNDIELLNMVGNTLMSLTVPYAINAGSIDGIDSSFMMKLDEDNIPTFDNLYTLGNTSNRYSNIYSYIFTGDLVGNSSTSTTLETARNITLLGDIIEVSNTFNGSSDITFNIGLNDSGVVPGEYSKVSVDNRGIITSASNLVPSDIISSLGYIPLNKSGDTVDGDLVVQGNLTISGTTFQVESEQITIADNSLLLNSNFTTGTPSENSGIEVLRGDDTTVGIRWNESNDAWEISDASGNYKEVATIDGGILNSDLLDGLDSTYFLDASNLNTGILPIERLPGLTGDITSIDGSNTLTLNTVPIEKGGTSLTSVGLDQSILSVSGGGLVYRIINTSSLITLTTNTSAYTLDIGDIGSIDRDIFLYSLYIWDKSYYLILDRTDSWYDIPHFIVDSLETDSFSYLYINRPIEWDRIYRLAMDISFNMNSIYDPLDPSWNDGRTTGVLWVRLIKVSDDTIIYNDVINLSGMVLENDIYPLIIDIGNISINDRVKLSIGIFWDELSDSWPSSNISGDGVTDNYLNYGSEVYLNIHKVAINVYDRMPS